MITQQQITFNWNLVSETATQCIKEEYEEMGINPFAQKWFADILKLLNINHNK